MAVEARLPVVPPVYAATCAAGPWRCRQARATKPLHQTRSLYEVVPLAPEPAAPAAPTRVYPCSLTDAEWALLAPLVQRPASPQGGRPPKHPLRQIIDAIRYLVHSGCAWRLLPQEFPPRARCTGGLPSGPPTAPWPGCTIPCASRSASRRVATWPLGGDHRLPVGAGGRHGPPTQPWVGCRQEGQRPQAAPGGGHPGVAAGGHGHRRQHPGPRRGPGAAVAPAGQLPRRAAVLGRWRVCRQAGRLGCGGAAPGGPDRAQAPGPVDLRGAAAPVGGGADLGVDRQASPHRARLQAAARPSRRDGHQGHGRGDDPPSCPFPSSTTSRCRTSDTVWVLTRLLLRVQRSASPHPRERHELDSPRELAAMSLRSASTTSPHCWIRRSRTS